jgi:hypothetical protein
LSGLRLDDTLRPDSQQVARILGHLLRSFYADGLAERIPEVIENAVIRLTVREARQTGVALATTYGETLSPLKSDIRIAQAACVSRAMTPSLPHRP